jgi:hypothetical protein
MFDDKFSDPASADDAYGHPAKPAPDASVPLSVAYLGVDCYRSPQQREHLRYSKLSNGRGGRRRCICDGDSTRSCSGKRNAVEANANACNQAEVLRSTEDGLGYRLGAGDQGFIRADHLCEFLFSQSPPDRIQSEWNPLLFQQFNRIAINFPKGMGGHEHTASHGVFIRC